MGKMDLYHAKYDCVYPLNYWERERAALPGTTEWKALSLLGTILNFQPMYTADLQEEYDRGYRYKRQLSDYAAEYPYAWYLLGWCCRETKRPLGLGNPAQAAEYFGKAADAQVAEGWFALGNYRIFYAQRASERQIAKGLEEIWRAAEQGLSEAVELLIRIFEGRIYDVEAMEEQYRLRLDCGELSEDQLRCDEEGTVLMFPEQLGMVSLDFAENEPLAEYWRAMRRRMQGGGEKPPFSEELKACWRTVLEAAKAYEAESREAIQDKKGE